MMKSTFKPVCKIEEHEVRQSVKEVIASIGFDLISLIRLVQTNF